MRSSYGFNLNDITKQSEPESVCLLEKSLLSLFYEKYLINSIPEFDFD